MPTISRRWGRQSRPIATLSGNSPPDFRPHRCATSISTPLSKQTHAEALSDKAVGYGMPGVRVDGGDVLAVYEATREAGVELGAKLLDDAQAGLVKCDAAAQTARDALATAQAAERRRRRPTSFHGQVLDQVGMIERVAVDPIDVDKAGDPVRMA